MCTFGYYRVYRVKQHYCCYIRGICLYTMVVALAGSVGQDDLHAAVGGVVGSLPFLPKGVADIVRVLLVKLQ